MIVTALTGLGAPAVVFAQQDSATGPRFRQAFATLPEGRTVRVLQASGSTVGRYSGIVGDSLSLRTENDQPTAVAIADVTAAWTRKHKAGKGALIGGIAGVVLGGLLGGAAQSLQQSDLWLVDGLIGKGARSD